MSHKIGKKKLHRSQSCLNLHESTPHMYPIIGWYVNYKDHDFYAQVCAVQLLGRYFRESAIIWDQERGEVAEKRGVA